MSRIRTWSWLWLVLASALVVAGCARPIGGQPGGQPVGVSGQGSGLPPNDYVILSNYDLGMHCTGFDFSYCCVLPPYNSILTQVVKTAAQPGEKPRLLTAEDIKKDNLVLWYEHEDNTYAEGNKLMYWNVPYDVKGNGNFFDPVNSLANGEFSHLYTYAENPLGFKPDGATKKLYVGKDINIPVDHGPTGKPLSDGTLDYTGDTGTVVYTTLNDGKTEIPVVLSQRGIFEALGLPLTPFQDSQTGSMRGVKESAIKPYQRARVTLAKWSDANGDGKVGKDEVTPLTDLRTENPVSSIATNPIDVPACEKCHASEMANGKEFNLYKKEYAFWKSFPNTSDYFARLKAAAISILEIHDARNGTRFLANYNPDDKTGAAVNRLGRPSVRCQDCHADNVLGVLRSAEGREKGQRAQPLTKAIHAKHLEVAAQPDDNGRAANCQTCHPAHNQDGSMDRFPIDDNGQFRGGDIRDKWGGCYVGRDVHSNPNKGSDLGGDPAHLNAVGRWLKENVTQDGKGLYCTNCHSLGSRLLYKADNLADAVKQDGESLRNKSIDEIVATLRKMDGGKYKDYTVADFFDPKAAGNKAADVWKNATNAPYNQVDDGNDFWLAAGEPHCADCHTAPFVENMGGTYFPIDQGPGDPFKEPGKYALYRYSKGHQGITCQGCHESIHGLYPVNPKGPDPTSREQAQQFNPDKSAGPLKCGSCHAVDKDGVPTSVTDQMLSAFPDGEYPNRYSKAVGLAHSLRSQQDATGLK